MIASHNLVKPEVTVAVLAYEINAIALTVAAEAESLVRGNDTAERDAYLVCVEMAGQLNALIAQLRYAAAMLRFLRQGDQAVPGQSDFS